MNICSYIFYYDISDLASKLFIFHKKSSSYDYEELRIISMYLAYALTVDCFTLLIRYRMMPLSTIATTALTTS